jgi:hypothetical protein
MQTPEIAKHLRWLKRAFPLEHRAIVKEVPRADIADKSDGYNYWTGKSFVVLIAESLSWASKIDALNHEWAHVRVKHVPDAENELAHNPLWSAEFGRIAAAYEAYKGNP